MTMLTEKIDIHIMESDQPSIDRDDFMAIICDTLKSKMDQTWRVRFHDDGTIAVYSFAIPPHEKILPDPDRLNSPSLLPTWIQERIAVLQICEQGEIIDGVGQKVSDKVFYVIE